MKLNLTTWQRVALTLRLMDGTPGVAELRKTWALLDLLELSAKEKNAVGFRADGDNLSWNPDLGAQRTEIDIEDPDLGVFLRKRAEGWSWPVEPRAELADLFEQIGV